MLEEERLNHILEYLRQSQTATVQALSKRLYASEATVRRDLNELARRGMVKRLHGGAALLDTAARELPLYVRQQQNAAAKHAMAAQAAQYLRDGQVIFLDASSTVMYLVKYLENFENLTVITNGIQTAQELQRFHHRTYCTGGLMLHQSGAYVGEHAADFLRRFNADLCFFSSQGLSEDGWITDDSGEETHIRRVMLEQSRKKIFLCDRSKVGQVYACNLCKLDRVDVFITDSPK